MKALVVSNIAGVSVSLVADIVTKRDETVATAKTITAIADDWALEDAVVCMRSLQSLSKAAEDSRTEVKAPVLNLGRLIDGKAKEFCAPIEVEVTRVSGLVSGYQAAKIRAAQEAERVRLAELARIEAEQKKALELEARRQREAAEAEAKRLQAEAEARTAFDAKDEAKAAAEAAEAEHKAKAAEAAALVETQRLAKLAEEKKRVSVPAVVAPKVKGLSSREVWLFEVTDLRHLYQLNPGLCRLEENTAAINDAIRAGTRDIPGLRIWSETKTEVRR